MKTLNFILGIMILALFSCEKIDEIELISEPGKDGQQGPKGDPGIDGNTYFLYDTTYADGTTISYWDIDFSGTYTEGDIIASAEKEEINFTKIENSDCFVFSKIVNNREIPQDTVCGLQGPKGDPGDFGEIYITESDTFYIFGKDTLTLEEFYEILKPARVVLEIISVDQSECPSGKQIIWQSLKGDSLISEINYCVPSDTVFIKEQSYGDTLFISADTITKIVYDTVYNYQVDSLIIVEKEIKEIIYHDSIFVFNYDTIVKTIYDSTFVTIYDTIVDIRLISRREFRENLNKGDTWYYEGLGAELHDEGSSINHNGAPNGNGTWEFYVLNSKRDTSWLYPFSPRNIYNMKIASGSAKSGVYEVFVKDLSGNVFKVGEKTISPVNNFIWWNADSYIPENNFVFNENNLLNPKFKNIVRIGIYVKNPGTFTYDSRNNVLNIDYVEVDTF